jgi:diguanylate cyclase (GGDEF)-like protein
VLLGYGLVPDGLAQDAVYLAVGASSVAAIALGARVHTPRDRLPWAMMCAGLLLWVLGDAASSWYQDVAHIDTAPTVSDAFYLAAYPVLGAGLALLMRGRGLRRDPAGWLDSATVTAGLGLLSWVLLADPILEASNQSAAAAAVAVAYPIGDILLLGLLIRLVTTPGGRAPAFWWLTCAVALLITADTISAALGLWSTSNTTAYDVIWLAAYVAWGTAALHPSMAVLTEPSPSQEPRFTPVRLAALATASLIAPGVLAVEQITGAPLDVWELVAGSIVLSLLVVSRMYVAVRKATSSNRERARLQVSLAHQADHDALTGLSNRGRALAEIEAALRRAQRTGVLLGLLYIDLDGFKPVNDTFGHRAGDDVLRIVADRLRESVRAGDLVARLGGDEFIVLLETLDAEADAVQMAVRVVESLSVPIPLSQARRPSVGASVGVAISQDGFVDAERLMHEADTACYRAKRAGRGRVEVFDDALRRELDERAELEAALENAIRCNELVLHYQPIVDLRTGAISGYEALVRWPRRGHGVLAPGDFIPTAEESDLICELDAWVLRRATSQLAAWSAAGALPRTVAVNISGRHISQPRIVAEVRQALAQSGLPASRLVLEITETVLVEDLLAIDHLRRIRELGVSVSIDDFGTGYNSIARLQNLPIDVLKIDRSFLDPRNSSRALLQLMVHAAHAFGLPVVVEGVSSVRELEMLRRMDCESVQGFFVSRPLPAERVPGFYFELPVTSVR